MKRILLLLIFSLLTLTQLQGQSNRHNYIDSLKTLLATSKNDTLRVDLLCGLADAFVYVKVDSAIYLSTSALNLSRRIGFYRGEAQALDVLGWAIGNSGNLVRALEIYYKCLNLSSQHNLSYFKAASLQIMGTIYDEDPLETDRAIDLYKSSSVLFDSLGDYFRARLSLGGVSRMYIKAGKLDSAEYYFNKTVSYAREHKLEYPWRPSGVMKVARGNITSAISDFQRSLYLAEKFEDDLVIIDVCEDLAHAYQLKSNLDSAFYFANLAMMRAREIGILQEVVKSADMIAAIYSGHDLEKTLYYTQIASAAKDSISHISRRSSMTSIAAFDAQEKQFEIEKATASFQGKVKQYSFLVGIGVALTIAVIFFRNTRQKEKANKVLENTLDNLKSTQSQLVQSEKMASLGELTAGIAHEIQNPLNFVNNFSEVSTELLKEMVDEVEKGNSDEVKAIARDVVQNLEKINYHGRRAADIVKGMLQHSRTSSGQKEPTDINALCDEYLRLSYHGLRAKDKSFNAKFETDFDSHLPKVNVIPQDIGRVILNLINNAFYAVNERLRQAQPDNSYEPTVTVKTKREGDKVLISVKDNGNGIPDSIKEKIFQPFFTTKPTGQGTGLGLSLSYDIVSKGHGGVIEVDSTVGSGTIFRVLLPVNKA